MNCYSLRQNIRLLGDDGAEIDTKSKGYRHF